MIKVSQVTRDSIWMKIMMTSGVAGYFRQIGWFIDGDHRGLKHPITTNRKMMMVISNDIPNPPLFFEQTRWDVVVEDCWVYFQPAR